MGEGFQSRQLEKYTDYPMLFASGQSANLFIYPVNTHEPLLGARHHCQASGNIREQDRPGLCFSGVRNGEEGVGKRE